MAAKKKKTFNAPKSDGTKVDVRTPNVPGYSGRVDKAKYEAMKKVVLKVIPKKAPGVTQAEMFVGIGKLAPKTLFPEKKYFWWGKCVQLDLEARGYLERDGGSPLRWTRVK